MAYNTSREAQSIEATAPLSLLASITNTHHYYSGNKFQNNVALNDRGPDLYMKDGSGTTVSVLVQGCPAGLYGSSLGNLGTATDDVVTIGGDLFNWDCE